MVGWSDSPTLLLSGRSLSAQSSLIFHSMRLIDVLHEVLSACTVIGTWTGGHTETEWRTFVNYFLLM